MVICIQTPIIFQIAGSIISFGYGIYLVLALLGTLASVLNEGRSHENAWKGGGIASRILSLGIIWR
jgi:hypothetical protein